MKVKTVKKNIMSLHKSIFMVLTGDFKDQLVIADYYRNPLSKYPLICGLSPEDEVRLYHINHEACAVRTGVMVQAVKDAEALAIAGKKEKDRAIRMRCPWKMER